MGRRTSRLGMVRFCFRGERLQEMVGSVVKTTPFFVTIVGSSDPYVGNSEVWLGIARARHAHRTREPLGCEARLCVGSITRQNENPRRGQTGAPHLNVRRCYQTSKSHTHHGGLSAQEVVPRRSPGARFRHHRGWLCGRISGQYITPSNPQPWGVDSNTAEAATREVREHINMGGSQPPGVGRVNGSAPLGRKQLRPIHTKIPQQMPGIGGGETLSPSAI